jgi:hypothetical protein
MTTSPLTDAAREAISETGIAAAHAGESLDTNPHPEGSEASEVWSDGFEAGLEGIAEDASDRAAGDDPRYELPDDPDAYERELAELHRSQF